jgi:hypothetical protein
LGVGRGANNSSPQKIAMLRNISLLLNHFKTQCAIRHSDSALSDPHYRHRGTFRSHIIKYTATTDVLTGFLRLFLQINAGLLPSLIYSNFLPIIVIVGVIIRSIQRALLNIPQINKFSICCSFLIHVLRYLEILSPCQPQRHN